jgi:hypothetical protein
MGQDTSTLVRYHVLTCSSRNGDEKTRPTRLDKLPQKVCQGLELIYERDQAVGYAEVPCERSTYNE